VLVGVQLRFEKTSPRWGIVERGDRGDKKTSEEFLTSSGR